VLNLLTFSQLTGDEVWVNLIEKTLSRLSDNNGSLARIMPMMMAGISVYHQPRPQVVIVGHRDSENTRAMLAALAASYTPAMVVLLVEPGDHQSRMAALLPFVGNMTMLDGEATAYVCKDFTCDAPTTDLAVLVEAINPRPVDASSGS
jgi:uncharacterized protein YyaL (SSP411 family)